jgi:CBS domain containing-hemolysin-like protein
MIILTVVFAMAFCLVLSCRGTWVGDALHKVLVEKPAESLNRGPTAVAAYVVAPLLLAGFAVVAPELIPLAAAVDFALAVELAALVFVARASGWSRAARLFVLKQPRLLASRLFRPASRSRQHQPKRKRQSAAQKDPEAWPLAFA